MDESLDIFIEEYLAVELFRYHDIMKDILVAEINTHIHGHKAFETLSTASKIILGNWEEYNKQRSGGNSHG